MTFVESLPTPNPLTSKDISLLFKILGHKNIRFVGGCVRNALLGEEIGDIDLATTLPPALVMEKLAAKNIKTIPTGLEHGTVTAVIGDIGYEITTLRRDIETDGRHAVVAYTNDWAEDAARRDLTINALYADNDGKIYDPMGTGLKDLKNRKIRFIGTATERITEDALRILRFFRFYTYYGRGQPDAKSLAACTLLADKINTLSRERITKEFFLILKHARARKTLQLMSEHNILPSIISNNIDTVRFDLLIKFQKKGQVQKDNSILAARLFLLRYAQSKNKASTNNQLIINKKIIEIIDNVSTIKFNTIRIDTQNVMGFIYTYGPSTTRIIIDIAAVLEKTSPRTHSHWIKYIEKTGTPVFPVTGKDLLKKGIKSGPQIGIILKKLERRWIQSGFKLTKQDMLA
ncbi:MAG: CCA tRNA nucleotidyltransferase [Pseudomonadota bacterium]